MELKSMSLGPLGTNCYIVHNQREAVIIDPGGDADLIASFLTKEKINPEAILLTHAHFDHIGAVEEIRSSYHIDVYVHKNEAKWLEDPSLNGSSLFLGKEIKTGRAEHFLEQGSLNIAAFSFEVIDTPGHSPGSVSFVVPSEKIVFGGDALFNRGIGRTDLPGGNFDQLADSIQNKLYRLPDSYTVYPGHGPATTIGDEKLNNPFVHG